jgi:hypothetical protein
MSFTETRVMFQQQTQNYMPENIPFKAHLFKPLRRERERERRESG